MVNIGHNLFCYKLTMNATAQYLYFRKMTQLICWPFYSLSTLYLNKKSFGSTKQQNHQRASILYFYDHKFKRGREKKTEWYMQTIMASSLLNDRRSIFSLIDIQTGLNNVASARELVISCLHDNRIDFMNYYQKRHIFLNHNFE